MTRTPAILLAALLAGCAGTSTRSVGTATVGAAAAPAPSAVAAAPLPAPAPADPLSRLSAFTIADLQAASADAHAQVPPDQTAYQCYDYLISFLPTITPPGKVPTMGAILVFQKGRDLANGVGSANGQLRSLNLACAPLVIDTQTLVNRLALTLGVAAAGTAVLVP